MLNNLMAELITSSVLLSEYLPPMASPNVHAYIDPGTGSLIIQIVIASLVGAAFLIKGFWIQVKAFFSNLFKNRRG